MTENGRAEGTISVAKLQKSLQLSSSRKNEKQGRGSHEKEEILEILRR